MKQLPWAIPKQSTAPHLSLLLVSIHPSPPCQPPQSSPPLPPPATSSLYHPAMTSPLGRYLQLYPKLEYLCWGRLGASQGLGMVVGEGNRSLHGELCSSGCHCYGLGGGRHLSMSSPC